jgi:hypothetical protein
VAVEVAEVVEDAAEGRQWIAGVSRRMAKKKDALD